MAGFARFAALIGLAVAAFAATAGTTLQDIRVWAAPERTRVVFDLSDSPQHSIFALDSPPRVVIDLRDTGRIDALTEALAGKGSVQRIRTGVRDGDDLRVVLDLSDQVPPKSFTLAPKSEYGHRLVVDLERTGKDRRKAAPAVTDREEYRKFKRPIS